MTDPVLTSKSSGARYGMVECSAAVSWTAMASWREVMGVGEGAREPRSMRMGVRPSSAIMMLPVSFPVSMSAPPGTEGDDVSRTYRA